MEFIARTGGFHSTKGYKNTRDEDKTRERQNKNRNLQTETPRSRPFETSMPSPAPGFHRFSPPPPHLTHTVPPPRLSRKVKYEVSETNEIVEPEHPNQTQSKRCRGSLHLTRKGTVWTDITLRDWRTGEARSIHQLYLRQIRDTPLPSPRPPHPSTPHRY